MDEPMFDKLRQGVVTIAVCFFVGGVAACGVLAPTVSVAVPNSLNKQATLYGNGHPVTNEPGRITSVAATDNGFLFVGFSSFTSPNGVALKELHQWDISDSANPQLIARIDFSDPGEKGMPNDPSFLAPYDLKVIKDHLIFWRNFELYSYSIGSDGSLQQVFKSDFADDLNPLGINRPSLGGNYLTSERQLLTNNQFLQLIDLVGYNRAEDLIAEHTLLNLQDPANPFLVRQNQLAGKNLHIFDPPPSGELNGLPARIAMSDNLQSLDVAYLQQLRDKHLASFWTPVLREVFSRRNLRKTLGQLSASIAQDLSTLKLVRNINTRLRNGTNLPVNISLSARIAGLYNPADNFNAVLNLFGIQPNDSVELALEKVVNDLMDPELEAELAEIVVGALLEQWTVALFGKAPRFTRSISNSFDGSFQSRVKQTGLEKYLVNAVIGPLIDLPAVFKVKLGRIVQAISDTAFGQAITAALQTFVPLQTAISAAGFDLPKCAKIPRNTKQFFKLLLTNAGPKLDLDNFAFIELLKVYSHYNGDSNYGRLIKNVKRELAALHKSLSDDLSLTLLKGLDLNVNIGDRLSSVLERARGSFNVRPAIARAVVAGISAQLEQNGIDVSLSVREVLEARGLFIEQARVPFGGSLATNAQFSLVLNNFAIASSDVSGLIQISAQSEASASAAGSSILTAELEKLVGTIWLRIFGAVSPDITLEKAFGLLISQQLNPAGISSYAESLIGELLANMSQSIPMPDLLDTAQRAANGNCLAKYQVTLLGLSLAPVIGEAALAAELAIAEAQEAALEFLVQQMLSTFFSQIYMSAGEHFPSWDLKLATATFNVPINQLTNRNVRFKDPFIVGDKAALVLRDLNSLGWIPGFSRSVEIVTFNPSKIEGSLASILLGEWDSVNSIAVNDRGFMAVAGTRLNDREFPESAVSIVKFREQSSQVLQLQGAQAEGINGIEELAALPSRSVYSARTSDDKVVLLAEASK